MRWIFIVLLAANVVYLGWELDRQSGIEIRNNRSVTVVPASAQHLQLLNEVQVLPESRRDEVSPGTGTADIEDLVTELPDILLAAADDMMPAKSCFSYGPVPDEGVANQLHQWFTLKNVPSRIVVTEEQGARLFWIYLAPQGSRENALAVLEEMQGKGIGDYRLINRGDLENAISLGLFSSREAVDARLRELQEKGYVPVVVPYTDVKKIYWLIVEVVNELAITDDLEAEYLARYTSVAVNCESNPGSPYTP